mgnify:CR=1 FL=1
MNKLTRIEELARKLNQEILALEVVQEYQKYEKLVLNDEKLKQLEKELKVLQKRQPQICYICRCLFITVFFYFIS